MKICQIMAGTGKGGLEKHTFELSNTLISKGYEVSVIAHPEFKNEFNSNVEFIPMDLTKSRNNIFTLYKIFKLLKEKNFYIIHTQANKATSMIAKIKPFLNIKFVGTLHNIKSNLKPYEKTDYAITVSNKIGERLETKKKTTIYNGINFISPNNVNLYEEYEISEDKFILCSVARFTKVKRLDILINAIRNINSIHLILVGSGKEESNLRKLVKELNIENRITFTGSLGNNKAKEIIASSSLFVMTSDNEGFPYTFVESMFCNTPFLSTPVSDVEEFIGLKYTIPFDNEIECEKKIEYIMNNYVQVKSDFLPIFNNCQKKLTIDNMVDETLEIYKKF